MNENIFMMYSRVELTGKSTTHCNKNSFWSTGIPFLCARWCENICVCVSFNDTQDFITSPTLTKNIIRLHSFDTCINSLGRVWSSCANYFSVCGEFLLFKWTEWTQTNNTPDWSTPLIWLLWFIIESKEWLIDNTTDSLKCELENSFNSSQSSFKKNYPPSFKLVLYNQGYRLAPNRDKTEIL